MVLVVYDFHFRGTPDLEADGVNVISLQVDGYAGAGRARCREPCLPLDPVRRKFYGLARSGPAPIAAGALTRIAELYKIQGEIRGRSLEERRVVRGSRLLVEALEPWPRDQLALVSQNSKLAEAVR
ncbi:transposase [Bradyrhizobium sp. WSM 1744]|uniref:Transposase n=1 Tax=Bradyrhizobium archetypum TaxID=2721160 RepID=A0A7Y4HCQ4_9BRAD|nr:transposase [Bradyrhizobium archetypum]